jgi:hypothetical protein
MIETGERLAKLSPDQLDLVLRRLQEKRGTAAVADRIGRRPGDGGPPPLSFSQRRLWFLAQLEPGSAAYNLPAALRLAGRLDLAALRRSLGEIVRRHEVLRTTFPAAADGEPRQAIAPPAPGPLALPLVDLAPLGQDRWPEALRLAWQEARRPFDLARGPLLRLVLVRLGEDEHALLVTIHHIVSDAWSTGIFLRELATLYAAAELTPLPIQYADFAVWQAQRLSGPALAAELAHWRQQLAGAPPLLELPTDRPRPAVQSDRGALCFRRLGAPAGAAVAAFSRRSGATPFMIFLAAFQALLSRSTHQLDISVGAPIAGRNRAEIEGLIGFFVNTLVLRAGLTGDPAFGELVRRAQ